MAAKYIVLAAQLRRLCLRLKRQGKQKLPGEAELAQRTGNSRQTVRHALSVLENEGLIRRRRGSGTYLSDSTENRSSRIAILADSAEDYLYPQLIRDVEAVCSPEGFTAEVFPTGNRVISEREILTSLLADPPAGILMEGSKSALPNPNGDLLSQIDRLGIPVVFLHAPLPVPESAPCIRDDNEGGSGILVRYLLGKGRRKVGGIFKSDDVQGKERYFGYLSELIKKDCTPDEKAILWYNTEDRRALLNGTYRWIEQYAEILIKTCDAVICYNDEIAYPLIRYLLKAGVRVPEDIAIVSFDNSHYCPISPVPITSLSHERHQMGAMAAGALLNLINGKSAHSARLTWSVKERASG